MERGNSLTLWRALGRASAHGDVGVVKRLLNPPHGIHPDFGTEENPYECPLILAAKHGHFEVIRELLGKGASQKIRDPHYGWTPLMYAVRYNHVNALLILLAAQGDPSQRALNLPSVAQKVEENSLKKLSKKERKEIEKRSSSMELSMLQPALIHDFSGYSVLHRAAMHICTADIEHIATTMIQAVPLLLNRRTQDEDEYAPIHVAVLCDRPVLTAVLIRLGCAIRAKDSHGRTPWKLAWELGRSECRVIIEQRGGRKEDDLKVDMTRPPSLLLHSSPAAGKDYSYVLDQQIGSGWLARVFTLKNSDKFVAKQFPRHLRQLWEVQKRLDSEIEYHEQCRHKERTQGEKCRFVPLYAYLPDIGSLLMKRMPASLYDGLEKAAALPEAEVPPLAIRIQWVIGVCLALEELHSRGRIHADLKSTTTFLTKKSIVLSTEKQEALRRAHVQGSSDGLEAYKKLVGALAKDEANCVRVSYCGLESVKQIHAEVDMNSSFERLSVNPEGAGGSAPKTGSQLTVSALKQAGGGQKAGSAGEKHAVIVEGTINREQFKWLTRDIRWTSPEILMLYSSKGDLDEARRTINTHAVDIYAVGVMLWECVTLKRPWHFIPTNDETQTLIVEEDFSSAHLDKKFANGSLNQQAASGAAPATSAAPAPVPQAAGTTKQSALPAFQKFKQRALAQRGGAPATGSSTSATVDSAPPAQPAEEAAAVAATPEIVVPTMLQSLIRHCTARDPRVRPSIITILDELRDFYKALMAPPKK